MKIKIITYTFSQNMGAILQAYNLQKYLEKNTKKEVVFTNYQPLKLYLRENFSFLKKKNIFSFITGIEKLIKIFIWKRRNFKIKRYQSTYDGEESLNVFGSDEIWNYSNPFFKYQKFYYGYGKSKTKVAYAVSVGSANLNNLDNDLRKNLVKNLSGFKKISVRDTNTKKFIKKILKIDTPIVVDPIFLNKNINLSDSKKTIHKKYILIYGKIKNKNDIKKILSYASKKNLIIISIIFNNDWADKNIASIDPWEFQFYIKNSLTVFTSMFHGVMYSVKLNKQFWISFDPYRKNKLEYFLKYLKLENRYLNKKTRLDNKINYKYVKSKLNIWIIKSKKFLEKNIK